MPTSMTNAYAMPRATLRLQFHRDFGFAEALARLDYFAALGVSHLYASPIFTAREGSTHGYDVTDPNTVNPELGGEDGLRSLAQALRRRGMGLILDIVPNHMAACDSNPWWRDVLQWGRQSRYAAWFDIDWHSADPDLAGKVLLPVLGRPYGDMLRNGEIRLRCDPAAARLMVACQGITLPLAPTEYADVLAMGAAVRLGPVIAAYRRATALGNDPERRQALAEEARRAFCAIAADAAGRAEIDAALSAYSAAAPDGMHALHALLERQHYRLVDWRNAGDEINWRRFFEIGELVGMRVERHDVFEAMHGLLFRLYGEGLIDGARIDHIDGLADPADYARRLRRRMQSMRADSTPLYLVAEKILAADESLPLEWELQGSTGYDFMDQAGALLHDAAGTAELDAIWQAWRAEPGSFAQLVRASRRRMLRRNFASDFNALSAALHALARTTIATRDLTLMAIRRVMLELLTHFPRYRTYGDRHGCGPRDAFLLRVTAARARRDLDRSDQAALDVVVGWLDGTALADMSETDRQLQWRALTRFQQLTPPLAAKSAEDTAFYRYGRLLSRNEVGADPARLGLSIEDFHRHAAQRQHDYPFSLLATATHDHKRGEDARARLAVLSEIPEHWRLTLQSWRALNQAARTAHAIDAADELMLYQTLVGAWPLDCAAAQLASLKMLTQRVAEWQCKALREAKRRTDWSTPDLAYEGICNGFLRKILRADPANRFLSALPAFIDEIAAAGVLNSLTQTMLRLSTPGVPDLYQGAELWDFSLVDPDNRGAVDYDVRQQLMAQGQRLPVSVDDWRSGLTKQQLIRAMLHFRGARPALFTSSAYVPLHVDGPLAAHLIAYARVAGDLTVIALGSRHAARLLIDERATRPWQSSTPLIAPRLWEGTAIHLPADWRYSTWQSALSTAQGAVQRQRIAVGDVLRNLPVELLVLAAA